MVLICISFMDRDENVVFTHNGILLSREEEWNLIICNQMDGTGERHSEQG
jgi:hypothetical protein